MNNAEKAEILEDENLTLDVLHFLEEIQMYISILYHSSTLSLNWQLKSFPMENKGQDCLFIHIQNHGTWRPDEARSQYISAAMMMIFS